jgi:hypothetical protein
VWSETMRPRPASCPYVYIALEDSPTGSSV